MQCKTYDNGCPYLEFCRYECKGEISIVGKLLPPKKPINELEARMKIALAIQELLNVVDPGLAAGNAVREGLRETPARVAKAWLQWTEGYNQDPAKILKVFEDGAESCDEMVIVKDMPFYSKCEHHLADIFGTVTIGYIPKGKVVGLSKLSRVVGVFAHRLQVQERMTNQIADAIHTHLEPVGVGVLVRARHMCMESRGIRQQGHHTVTCALRGAIRTESQARGEFLTLAK